jgi:phytanoyl-CoA hydroxylase
MSRTASSDQGHQPSGTRSRLQWPSDSELPGVIRLPGFLAPDMCDTLRAVASEIVSRSFRSGLPRVVFGGPEPNHDQNPLFLDSGSVARVFHEPVETSHVDWETYRSSVARIGHGLHVAVPEVQAIARDHRLSSQLGALGYTTPAVVESLFLMKSAHAGQLHVHVDHTFLWTDPPTVTLLWLALEDADPQNGCLYVDPRGPLSFSELRMRRSGNDARIFGASSVQPAFDELVALPATKGDLLMVDGLLAHASGPGNSESRTRDALALHVIDLASHIPSDLYLGDATLFMI